MRAKSSHMLWSKVIRTNLPVGTYGNDEARSYALDCGTVRVVFSFNRSKRTSTYMANGGGKEVREWWVAEYYFGVQFGGVEVPLPWQARSYNPTEDGDLEPDNRQALHLLMVHRRRVAEFVGEIGISAYDKILEHVSIQANDEAVAEEEKEREQ